MKTRSDIQGLRALAVALVVLSHANLLHLTGGYIGVDVFFVISGYLITSIILREYAANALISNGLGWFSLRAFYLRRFKRIVPAAMLVLLTTTVISYLIFNSVRAHGIAIDALWSAFFLANLHFINLATDYFQQGFSTSPLQHFWSLAVEEQFYLIFPTLLLGALSLHGIKIRNYALNWRRRVGILIGVISLASFGWAIYATGSNPASSYFSSFSRAWELGLGALLAVFAQSSKAVLPLRARQLTSGIGLLAILVTAFLFTSATPFPGFYTLIPTLGTALIIGSGINAEEAPESFIQKISNFAPIAYLGTISYSVYLWHLPILVIASQRYANESTKLWFKLVLIAAIVLVSAITYNFYEGPLRHKIKVPTAWYQTKFRYESRFGALTRSRVIRNLSYTLGVLVVVAALALVFIPKASNLGNPQGGVSPTVAPTLGDNQTATSKPSTQINYATLLSAWQQKIFKGQTVSNVKNLVPSFKATAGVSPWKNPDCNKISPSFEAKNKNVIFCSAGSGSKVAVLIGNSHARMLQTTVTEPLVTNGYTVYSIFIGNCSITDITILYNGAPIPYCDQFHSAIQSFLKMINPNLVVLSESLIKNFVYKNTSYSGSSGFEKFSALYLDSLKNLRQLTKQLVIMGQIPTLPKSPLDCVDSNQNFPANCQADGNAPAALVKLQKNYAVLTDSHFIDLRDWMCSTRARCPLVIDNTLVYSDSSHLTYTIENKFAPLFSGFLSQEGILSRPIVTPTAGAATPGSNYVNFPGISEPTKSNISYSKYLSGWKSTVEASTKFTKLPFAMFPSISGLQQNWKPAALFTQQTPVNAKKLAYIFGDSTAQRIPYLLSNNLDANSWKIVMRSFPGCDLGSVNATGYQGINCRKLQNLFFAEVKSHSADLVLITEQNNWFQNTPDQTSLANAKVNGLLNNLKFLAAHTKRLIFLGSLPTATPLVDCVSGQTQLSPSCFANQNNFSYITAMEIHLVKSVGGIYVNNSDWFCSNSVCPPIIGSTPVMIDKQHMTDAMSQKLSVLFGYWLWSQPWAKDLE